MGNLLENYPGRMKVSGIKLEFATNNEIFTGGIKAHNYNRGNFFTPTSFTARIGPFAPDTLFLGRVMALDTDCKKT